MTTRTCKLFDLQNTPALHLLKLIVMAMMSKAWGVSSLRKLAGQRPFRGAEKKATTTAEGGKEGKRRSFTQGNFHVEMRKVRLRQKLSLVWDVGDRVRTDF